MLKKYRNPINNFSNTNYPFYFLTPLIIVYFFIFLLPLLATLFMSFTDWSIYRSGFSFNGIENFIELIKGFRIANALKNTIFFAITVVVLQNLLGFILALLLYKKTLINEIFRAIFFIPAVLSTIIIGVVFNSILYPSGGLNKILSLIFFNNVNIAWLGSIKFSIFIIGLVNVWQWAGFTMMIYVASINSISVELFEAAYVEGAGRFHIIKNIIIPLIIPGITINLLSSMIGSLRIFDLVLVLTKGGPGRATEVLNLLIYSTYSEGKYGKSIAIQLILLILVIIISFPIYISMKKRVVEV